MEIFESEKREKYVFYIIFSQKTEHGKKRFRYKKWPKSQVVSMITISTFYLVRLRNWQKLSFAGNPVFA
jgi:hypothetical protein